MPVRDNRFAQRLTERQQEQARQESAQDKRKLLIHDSQPSIIEQLLRLEEDIRRLKVEFDVYFNGSAKRPPYDTKGRVETLIKRLADERTMTYGQRYHYNALVARYTSFRDLWRRTLQDREECRGPLAVAAAERRAASRAATPAPDTALASARATFVCADARADVPTVKNLYDALVAAKRVCKEPVDNFSFAQFHRMLAAKTDVLKERLQCERVRYSIHTEDGRVNFKARAEK